MWRIERVELTYRHEFRISRGGSAGTTNLLARVEEAGLTAWGEAIPVRYYGWTIETMQPILEAIAADWRGTEPEAPAAATAELRARYPDQLSAVAAADAVIWDLAAQRAGQSVAEYLGLDPTAGGLTAYTIGLATLPEMLAKAAEAAEFPILKVKCGGPEDLAVVRRLREITGKRLWVDANGGWRGDQAEALATELAALGVELIEQPVDRADIDGLAAVTAVSPVPIIADESCHTAADVPRLAGAVDGVNIKLPKCGGIGGALEAIAAARRHGLKVMLGCFCSSSVAATQAAHLAPLVDWRDLDGALLVANDPLWGMTAPAGKITLPPGPGLGMWERGKA